MSLKPRALRATFNNVTSNKRSSEVVGAAQVIATLRADQLAVVAGELVAARGAQLAMMVYFPRSRVRAGDLRLTM